MLQIPELCGEPFTKGPLMALLPTDRTTRVVLVKDLGCESTVKSALLQFAAATAAATAAAAAAAAAR